MSLLTATPVTPQFLAPFWLAVALIGGLLFLVIWMSKR